MTTYVLELTEEELRGLRNAVSFAGYDYFDQPEFVNGLMAKLTDALSIPEPLAAEAKR